jgi:hypothetical protein
MRTDRHDEANNPKAIFRPRNEIKNIEMLYTQSCSKDSARGTGLYEEKSA